MIVFQKEKYDSQQMIKMLEEVIFGAIKKSMAGREAEIIDYQKPFFSKRHYYDEDGNIISELEDKYIPYERT